MPRNHRKPGIVRVVCTDAYHRDSAEFAEYGHHYLGTLRIRKYEDIRKPAIRPYDDTMFLKAPGMYRGPDFTVRFRCACGRDYQRHDSELLPVLKQLFEAEPGATRVTVDIATLERLDHVR